MGKYPEVDLNISEDAKNIMTELMVSKQNMFFNELRALLDKHDMGFIVYATLFNGSGLGEYYDSVFAARNDFSKAYPHTYSTGVIANSRMNDIDNGIKGELKDLEDGDLVIAFAHGLMLINSTAALGQHCVELLERYKYNVQRIKEELTNRGIHDRAVLKPIKMNVQYKIITTNGEFLTSYGKNLIFTVKNISCPTGPTNVTDGEFMFIGNVQSDGNIHHTDDLPIFSTQCGLLFGYVDVPVTTPAFITDEVVSVVEVNAIN